MYKPAVVHSVSLNLWVQFEGDIYLRKYGIALRDAPHEQTGHSSVFFFFNSTWVLQCLLNFTKYM